MSIRQPESSVITTSRPATEIGRRRGILAGHLRQGTWVQRLQEIERTRGIVFQIGRKHDQEKSAFRGERKSRNIEYRVIRHRNSVNSEHTDYAENHAKHN